MRSAAVCVLAIARAALAIPPPSFGFPEAPNDTALAVGFPQTGGSNVFVQEAELFGINIPAQAPNLGVLKSRYQSLAEYNGSYFVIMVDPDASYPENPTKRFILHWMQANFTSSNFTNTDIGYLLVNTSAPIAPYLRPSPPTNSSAHRYIIYAFEQPTNLSLPANVSSLATSRTNFNLTNFINETRLGTPAAANFFYVSNQSSVPVTFQGAPGSQYPGGDGTAVTSGDPYKPTAASSSAGTSSSTAAAAIITGAGSLLGAGLVGLAALI